MPTFADLARESIRRCRILAGCTEHPGHITRTFLSAPMRDAHRLVRGWMESAGMQVRVDAVGNLRGICGAGPRLMIGSHLDTVPDAGAFDGILGVMMAIALVECKPACAIEVIGFSDEEGTRFGVPFLGSLALLGTPIMDAPVLDAIRAFGLDPAQLPDAVLAPDVRGFLEFHIEQGPVLAGLRRGVAVVDNIVGQSRGAVRFAGRANHAGTTPMDARRDALAAAAEWIGAVEASARRTHGLMATVGRLEVEPGAANVIPGVVRASIDIRHAHDAVRLEAINQLRGHAMSVARTRHVECDWHMTLDEPATPMNRAMVEWLGATLRSCGLPDHRMSSGAGHDAMVLARKVPAAMLFVRSPNGVSHHPDETVLPEDVEAALQVGAKFPGNLEASVRVRGGRLVTPEGVMAADMAVEDGVIVYIGQDLPTNAGAADGVEIDASQQDVLPALIDVHVHFNEPGNTAWEGGASGSRALAAGGGALFFDMPLNSLPCTVDAAAFDAKRAALEQTSITDFALWGGLIPGNRGRMEELADRGVVGFKAFMTESGLPEFPRADDDTLFNGMREAARLGLPVAVHAEDHQTIRKLTAELPDDPGSIHEFLETRPVEAEVKAIEHACRMAGETGAKLHIVHISSGRGAAAAANARAHGVDVTLETCPHYLRFTEEDLFRKGAIAKCAPPLRPAPERASLWAAVNRGDIDIIASDHSPAPGSMKGYANFFSVWGGVAGVQSTLPILLSEMPLERVAQVTAANPAARFGIPRKGKLAVGYDADFVVASRCPDYVLQQEQLFQRHGLSPYVGESFSAKVHRTVLRGSTVFLDGRIADCPPGRLVKPQRT